MLVFGGVDGFFEILFDEFSPIFGGDMIPFEYYLRATARAADPGCFLAKATRGNGFTHMRQESKNGKCLA